ncbi:hypothetical protein TVNIR_3356 [Thioalkalivibrio nitratireducens DSM 14787]|uniref:Uncharacterized protein n=1 Tax=Thioalkalivibrio nitratireducens (strain DSM 14787 / UNIQEM 213 / ALEN2) TaxID=1255043 RepID=L0DZH5_THIND|nr:hypothetical protein TVNIR_3356 [Thioalkalivibrio nitratireducens DSM 14787]
MRLRFGRRHGSRALSQRSPARLGLHPQRLRGGLFSGKALPGGVEYLVPASIALLTVWVLFRVYPKYRRRGALLLRRNIGVSLTTRLRLLERALVALGR